MNFDMDEQRIARYMESIYQSLLIDPEPAATIVRLRQQNDEERGTVEWREAIRRAIAKFEARP